MANCWIGDKPLSVLINPIRTRRVAILVLARGGGGGGGGNNHKPSKVWHGITYQFLNFNGCTVEV